MLTAEIDGKRYFFEPLNYPFPLNSEQIYSAFGISSQHFVAVVTHQIEIQENRIKLMQDVEAALNKGLLVSQTNIWLKLSESYQQAVEQQSSFLAEVCTKYSLGDVNEDIIKTFIRESNELEEKLQLEELESNISKWRKQMDLVCSNKKIVQLYVNLLLDGATSITTALLSIYASVENWSIYLWKAPEKGVESLQSVGSILCNAPIKTFYFLVFGNELALIPLTVNRVEDIATSKGAADKSVIHRETIQMLADPRIREMKDTLEIEKPLISRADTVVIGKVIRQITYIVDDPSPAPNYDKTVEPWSAALKTLKERYNTAQLTPNLLQKSLEAFVEPVIVPVTIESQDEIIRLARNDPDSKISELGKFPTQYAPFIKLYGGEAHLNLKDLFHLPTQSVSKIEKAQHLLLQGQPGSGKTTLTNWLAWSWGNEDGPASHYQWVFLFDLRVLATRHRDLLISSQTRLADILHAYFFKDSLNKAQVQSIIANHKASEILLILDGINELPKLESLPGLIALLQTPFTTWVTSRLQRAEEAMQYCDVALNLLGFDDRKLRNYLHRRSRDLTIPDCEDIRREQKADELFDYLEKNPTLWSIAHNPFNINLLVHLWLNAAGNLDEIGHLSTITNLYNILADKTVKGELLREPGNCQDPDRLVKQQSAMKQAMAFLESLAFHAMKVESWLFDQSIFMDIYAEFFATSTPTHTAQEFANLLTKNSPFLNLFTVEVKSGEKKVYYSFSHATFEEFFAARFLTRQAGRVINDFAVQHRFNPHYQMMLIFSAGLLSRNKTQHELLLPILFQSLRTLPLELSNFYNALIAISWANECELQAREHLFANQVWIHELISWSIEEALTKPEQGLRDKLINYLRFCPGLNSHRLVTEGLSKYLLSNDNPQFQYRAVVIIHKTGRNLTFDSRLIELVESALTLDETRFEAAQALGNANNTQLVIEKISEWLCRSSDELWGLPATLLNSLIQTHGMDALVAFNIANNNGLRLKANLFVSLGRIIKRTQELNYVPQLINSLIDALGNTAGYNALRSTDPFHPPMPLNLSAALTIAISEAGSSRGWNTAVGGQTVMPVPIKAMMEVLHFIAIAIKARANSEVIKTGVRALDSLFKKDPEMLIGKFIDALKQPIYISIAVAYALLHLTHITREERRRACETMETLLTTELTPLNRFVLQVTLSRLTEQENNLTQAISKAIAGTDSDVTSMALFFISELQINAPSIVSVLIDILERDESPDMAKQVIYTLYNLGPRSFIEIRRIRQRYERLKEINPTNHELLHNYLLLLAQAGTINFHIYSLLKDYFMKNQSIKNVQMLVKFGQIDEDILHYLIDRVNGPDRIEMLHDDGSSKEVELLVCQRAAELLGQLDLTAYLDEIVTKIKPDFLPISLKSTPILGILEHFAFTGQLFEICRTQSLMEFSVLLYDGDTIELLRNGKTFRVKITNVAVKSKLSELSEKFQLEDSTSHEEYKQLGRDNMPVDSKKLADLFETAKNLQLREDKINELVRNDPPLKESWLKDFKENESAAFAQFPFHPNGYECACLADSVYNPEETKNSLPPGWQLVRIARNDEDGYVGAAYWHQAHRHLVIAHQGTVSMKQIWVDMNAVVRNNIDPLMASATKFTLDTVAKMMELPVSVTITGHSLGAWLSQATGLHLEEIGVHSHIVVFESPGCQNMLTNLLPSQVTEVTEADLDVTIYLSAPNYINTLGPQLPTATIYHVFHTEIPWDGYAINAKGYIDYLTQVHSMKNMRAAFNSTSGFPNRMKRMQSWPSTILPEGKMSEWKPFALIGRIKDFIYNCTDVELSEFLVAAKALNNLTLADKYSLPFDSHYMLTYLAHYQTVPDDSPLITVRETLFTRKARDFLHAYLNFKTYTSSATGAFLLKANHERYTAQGYLKLRGLLDKYTIQPRTQIISTTNNENETFVRYLSHVVRLDPDVTVLRSNAFETIMEEIDKKLAANSGNPPPLLADEVGELFIGQYMHGGMFFGKDTPLETIKEFAPIIKELANGEKSFGEATIPKLVGKADRMGILQILVGVPIFSNMPEFNQDDFKSMVDTIRSGKPSESKSGGKSFAFFNSSAIEQAGIEKQDFSKTLNS